MTIEPRDKTLEEHLLDIFQLFSEVQQTLLTLHLQGTQGEKVKDKVIELGEHIRDASNFLIK